MPKIPMHFSLSVCLQGRIWKAKVDKIVKKCKTIIRKLALPGKKMIIILQMDILLFVNHNLQIDVIICKLV